MVDREQNNRRHFIFQNSAQAEGFTSPGRGGSNDLPTRDRHAHGNMLLSKLQQLNPVLRNAVEQQRQAGIDEGFGLQIEFASFPTVELAFESLARERSGIELRNVRQQGNITFATVFVPDGKLTVFEKWILAYLDESKDKKNGPAHSQLLNTIADIRAATLQALWTDALESIPTADDEHLWWEVWLPTRGDRLGLVEQFKAMATELNFRIAAGELYFPERSVLLLYGSVGQMKRSMMMLNCIAELRRAKETAEFFDSLPPSEQSEWVDELNERLEIVENGSDVPYVCLLDTGVNNGHPLLQRAITEEDKHSVDPNWGLDDVGGHGTGLAGLALLGNLTDALSQQTSISVSHRLESVKLLPKDGANSSDSQLHGYLMTEAVARPTVTAPHRKRVFSMAITAKDNRDRGRPSAWSATIDRLAYDADEQGETPKLFVISAGNINDPNAWMEYPNSNSSDGIHDPAQAWNALTVGAMTDLVNIQEDARHYTPIAEAGGLSPFSTTSQTWQAHWPLKPDVVFEGGNVAKDGLGAAWMPSLSLLTTHASPSERLLTTSNATSAASALCARMAAQLMANYPDLWPESIRGLIVHSAEWTAAMKSLFLPARGTPTKAQMTHLVRHCGFGEPDLERALWSAGNSLTMICEETLQPFKREPGKDAQLRDMNLHRLPWPLDELEVLGNTQVAMRVTLSYFIEPNPSARGVTSRYCYESHGLRFDVKRPLESEEQFRARINAAARDDDERANRNDNDPDWIIGKMNRHKGSLHADIWRGSAAELASRGAIAIYPARGWWKTRPVLERYNQRVRYSLIVSISAPSVDVDLYTPIANQIGIPVVIE
ncbi:S8 family peptidase [Serratia microhaemolytica]|uniref:S8 family peptidase n=1 Tax=Serratia microhaemolytica TaxID=2675110 RepID=UPI000FDE3842|nr:S8 family peptidase [Serratia microhaemolytica]